MRWAGDVIFWPAESVSAGERHIAYRRKYKDIVLPMGIPSIDLVGKLVLFAPGDLMTVIGRPGHGKSAFMLWWARHRALWLSQAKDSLLIPDVEKRIVVFITYEQPIEELYTFITAADTHINTEIMKRGTITDEEMERIVGAGVKRLTIPLWFIGHSLERRKRRPRITMEVLMNSLYSLEDERGLVIDSVFIDYLQCIPLPGRSESMVIGTGQNLNDCKDGALDTGCPWIVGCQAGRQVDEYKPPIPMTGDGQWTSNIEQKSDSSVSVVRLRRAMEEGEYFGKKNPVLVKGKTQFLIYLLKQKVGEANMPYFLNMDPRYNQIADNELRYASISDEEPRSWTG